MSISENEKTLLKHLDSLYSEGCRAREKASGQGGKKWKNGIDLVRGKMWPDRRPKYKVDAVMNFVSEILQRKTALLIDSKPTITVASRHSLQDPVCEVLKQTIEGILEEMNFEQKLMEFVMYEQHFGFGIFNTCYDKNLDYGQGDIDLIPVDPRSFIFDPFITRSWNLKYGEYKCMETIKPLELLRDSYPDRADDIKPDLMEKEVTDDSVISKIKGLFGFDNLRGEERSSVIERSIVRDWWVKDRTSRESGKDGKRGELLFPTWRHIIVAGGCPVEDGRNPYIDGNDPFDGMEWTLDVDSVYGVTEIENLENPQIMFNKVLASILENAILMGNGIWIGDRDALTEQEWKRLNNEPGSQVRKRTGKELRRETPPALPNYIMQTLEVLGTGLEKLSGITEVIEGRRPGQAASGIAIEGLAQLAQTTLRMKAHQLESVIQRVGQKLISRIFAYYTSDRVFNFVGNDGHVKQYLYQRQLLEKVIRERGVTAFRDYTFKVVPTSSLAMTKWQKGIMASQLFQMGLLDEEATLDTLEWPNRNEILQRMNDEKKEQAKLMMAMGGTGGQVQGAGGFKERRFPQKFPANALRGPAGKERPIETPRMGE